MGEKKATIKKASFQVSEQTREPVVAFDNVHKKYTNKEALVGVNFTLKPGEFVSLIGEAGAGKSTLTKIITREVTPSSGHAFVFGENIARMPLSRVPYLRRRIGVVFQDYKLLPNKTVYENVAFVLEAGGFTNEEIASYVTKVLELVGLTDKRNAYPSELSGGLSQRTSIARAIVKSPKLLIADEPTGNLDPKSALDILELLVKINALGTTVLLITHNDKLVNMVGKRVVTLTDGRVTRDIESGKYVL